MEPQKRSRPLVGYGCCVYCGEYGREHQRECHNEDHQFQTTFPGSFFDNTMLYVVCVCMLVFFSQIILERKT